MKSFFDLQIDFFLPVWRRIVLIAVCVGWAGLEFYLGVSFWGFLFLGVAVIALWQFFLSRWPQAGQPPDNSQSSESAEGVEVTDVDSGASEGDVAKDLKSRSIDT